MHLRASARFHDGKPITPEDVIFSLRAQEGLAQLSAPTTRTCEGREDRRTRGHLPVRHQGQPRAADDHRRAADPAQALLGGQGANGEPRDLGKSTLEIPLGSGPYRIKEVDAGRTITYERVKDWWAKDLPVTKGQWNFDEIRFVYSATDFRLRGLQGGQLDYWRESERQVLGDRLRFRRGQAKG